MKRVISALKLIKSAKQKKALENGVFSRALEWSQQDSNL